MTWIQIADICGRVGWAVPCEVILVIHALTQWNLDGRCQGHVDTPLCEAGRLDALALARRLQNERIDAIYSSDLRRAVETVQHLADLKQLPIHTDSRLREGRWASQERTSEYPVLPFAVEVEDREAVKTRMVEVMTEIACRHDGDRVVVLSHSGPVKQFIGHVAACSGTHPPPQFTGVRAAINRLMYRDGSWSSLVLDDASHLRVSDTAISDGSSDSIL